MKHLVWAVFLLPLLAACGGGGASVSGSATSPGLPASLASQASDEALSDSRNIPFATPVPTSSHLLYVGNVGNNSITVYWHDAQGNASPLYVISGSNTRIDGPGQLSEDAAGNLYVANGARHVYSGHPAILVFAHGANGNVAPIRVLAGSSTGLHSVRAMTVDQITGKIFVVDQASSDATNDESLLRFPPNANGNVAPFARGSGNLEPSNQIASDSTGQNLIDSHDLICCDAVAVGVTTVEKQFPNATAPTIVYSIQNFDNEGVADDPTTKTYLVGTPSGIVRLAENTAGDGSSTGNGPTPSPQTLKPAPISTITSDTCASQFALGYLRNIYVTHSKLLGGCPTDAVYVFTHDSSGSALPLRVLSGSATKLNEPFGIYAGK